MNQPLNHIISNAFLFFFCPQAIEEYNSERMSTVPLIISVTDVNNNCPYFEESDYAGQMEPGDEYVLLDGSTDERLLITAIDMDEVIRGVSFDFRGGAWKSGSCDFFFEGGEVFFYSSDG